MRPILEYAVCIWNPYLSRDIDLIERVQHRATKCVKGLRSKSYNERLKALNLESLQTRRNVLDLCEVFKLLHSLTIHQLVKKCLNCIPVIQCAQEVTVSN